MEEKFDKIKYNNEFNRKKYDKIELMVKRGDKEKIKEHAAGKGYKSINKYVCDMIYSDMESGGAQLRRMTRGNRAEISISLRRARGMSLLRAGACKDLLRTTQGRCP